MKLATPQLPAHRALRFIAVAPGPRDLLSLARAWFPYAHEPATGEYLVHLSVCLFIMRSKVFRGFADPAARETVRAYLRAGARTFSPDKLRPLTNYNWARHFTPAFQSRPYQLAGMEMMYDRARRWRTGTLLGDDTGMGKTPQVIGVLQRLRAEGLIVPGHPAVIVTLSGMKSQWADEIEVFARPRPAVSLAEGGLIDRRGKLADPDAEVVVTNYEVLRLPQYAPAVEELRRRRRAVVLDETIKVINPDAATTVAARAFCRGAPFVVALNATPIENGLLDLMTQFSVMDRNVLGDLALAAPRYIVRDAYGRVVKTQRVREFKARCACLYVRRRSEECGDVLPAVVSEIKSLEMDRTQSAAYRRAAGEYLAAEHRGAVGMANLAAVQYAACAADLNNPRSPSAKLDYLEGLLTGELAGQRVVVFSRFKRVIVFAARRLAALRPFVITGDTPQAQRSLIRRQFSAGAGAGRALLGTDAIGHGLNLQAAGVVVNLDLPWTPGRLRQRLGRVRRFSQERRSVLMLNLVARLHGAPRHPVIDGYFAGTVLPRKQDLIERVFGREPADVLGADPIDVGAVRRYLRGANTP